MDFDASWGAPGHLLGRLGASWGRLGGVLARLGGVLAALERRRSVLRASWGRLGGVLGCLGGRDVQRLGSAPAPAGSQAPRPANIKRQLNKETSM